MDNHIDLVGSVTYVEIFSKTNNYLYYVNSVTIVDIFFKDNIGQKTLLKHSPTILYNLFHEIIGFNN